MADLSDVEQALVALVGTILYPNGDTAPGVLGTTSVAVYSGWPVTEQLDADIKAGRCNVSIFSMPQGSRNTSRYGRDWQPLPAPECTLTAAATGNVVTYGGAAATGQLAAFSASEIGFVYQVQASDTPASIAAALTASINSDGRLTATSSGPAIAVTDDAGLTIPATGTTAALGTSYRETRRQEQRVMVTCWCPSPELRDQLASAIDNVLSDTDWLDVGDPVSARFRYFSTSESDAGTDASAYRRDLHYLVEYATIQTQTSAPMLASIGLLHALGVDISFGAKSPISGFMTPDGGQTLELDAAGNVLVQPTP